MTTIGKFWVRKNGGDWNADPTANPATGVGGFSLAGLKGYKTYPTAIVDGDAGVTFNFGASPFVYDVPSGFAAGWLKEDGSGYTNLDPSKLVGNATLSDGNLTLHSGSGSGWCQSADGKYKGNFYFEFTFSHFDIFATSTGAGIGRAYPGIRYDYWTSGAYSPTDNNGGATLVSSFILIDPHGSAWGLGVDVGPNIFTLHGGENISMAFTLVNNSKFEMKSLSANQTQPVAEDDDLVTMRYSDDGGKNWSDPKTQTLGAVGEYQKNISFRNIGMGRNKLIEVSWSSPRKVSLGGGTILADVAGS